MDKGAMLSFFFGSLEGTSVKEESVPSRNEDYVEYEAEKSCGNGMNVRKYTDVDINVNTKNMHHEESAVLGTEDEILQESGEVTHNPTALAFDRSLENMSAEILVVPGRIEDVTSTEVELPQDNKLMDFVVDKSLECMHHNDSAVLLQGEGVKTAGYDCQQGNGMNSDECTASVVSSDFMNDLSKGNSGEKKLPQVCDVPTQDNSDASNIPCELVSDYQEKGQEEHQFAVITPHFDTEVECLEQEPLISMDICRENKSHLSLPDEFSIDREYADDYYALECSDSGEHFQIFGDVEAEKVQSPTSEAEMIADDIYLGVNVSSVGDEDQFMFDCKRELVEVPRMKFKPKKRVVSNVGYVATKFNRGDLVWAKVKSHPWWPGQVFNASDASLVAKKTQRSGKLLVAFFGDGTFGWLEESQLIDFRPNFEEKAKQTTMKSFSRAVAAALDEIRRRSELGLNHPQHNDLLLCKKNTFPHPNAGIQSNVQIDYHQDISMSRYIFNPGKLLEFVKNTAQYPFYPQDLSIEHSELCGHAYGVRAFMVNADESNMLNMELITNANEKAMEDNLKRRFSTVEAAGEAVYAERKEAKKPHLGEKVKKSQLSEDAVMDDLVPSSVRIQVNISPMEGIILVEDTDKAHEDPFKEATSGKGKWLIGSQEYEKGEVAEKLTNLGESETVDLITQKCDGETNLPAAGYPSKAVNKEQEKILKGEKHMKPLFSPGGFILSLPNVSKNPSDQSQGSYKSAPEAFAIREFKGSGNVQAIEKYPPYHLKTEPSSGKARKMLDGEKRTKSLSPSEGENLHKAKKMKSDIREADRDISFMHRSKEQDWKGIAKKLNLSSNISRAECSITNYSTLVQNDFDAGSEASVSSKATVKKFGHSLIEVVQGLQVLARDPLRYANRRSTLQQVFSSILRFRNHVFLKSSGYGVTGSRAIVNTKAVERVQFATQNLKSGKPKFVPKEPSYELNEVKKQPTPKTGKSNMQILSTTVDLERKQPVGDMGLQSHTYASQAAKHSTVLNGGVTTCVTPPNSIPGLQELATAARKKKSEVEQEMATTRNIEQSFQEKLSRIRFADLRHSHKNMKQHHSSKDPSESSHMKMPLRTVNAKATDTSLGLFMQFPKDFTMPSEAQVNDAFNKFGILENAGIRIYKDNSAAQVIFKLNSDAEAALKYALENRIFGADVSYKLRHFSRSQKHPAISSTSISNQTISRRGEQGKSLSVNPVRDKANSIDSVVSTCIPPDPVFSHQQTSYESLRSNKVTAVNPVREKANGIDSAMSTFIPPDPVLSHQQTSYESLRSDKVTAVNPVREKANGIDSVMSTCIPPDPVFSHQQTSYESLRSNKVTAETNTPNLPSASTVNVPSCDIKDQMMKLLHEVSLIVSSCSLKPKLHDE